RRCAPIFIGGCLNRICDPHHVPKLAMVAYFHRPALLTATQAKWFESLGTPRKAQVEKATGEKQEDRSTVKQLAEVAIVVEAGAVLDKLQDAVHVLLAFTVQFIELHCDSRTGVDTDDIALGVQLAVVNRKHKSEAGTGRQNCTGLNVATTETDVDE